MVVFTEIAFEKADDYLRNAVLELFHAVAVAVLFYDIDLSGWPWLLLVLPLAAAGLAALGTIAGSLATTATVGPALIPLIVARLAVPLLLAASEIVEGLRTDTGILRWLLLMVIVDLVLCIVGVVTARPLQETQ